MVAGVAAAAATAAVWSTATTTPPLVEVLDDARVLRPPLTLLSRDALPHCFSVVLVAGPAAAASIAPERFVAGDATAAADDDEEDEKEEEHAGEMLWAPPPLPPLSDLAADRTRRPLLLLLGADGDAPWSLPRPLFAGFLEGDALAVVRADAGERRCVVFSNRRAFFASQPGSGFVTGPLETADAARLSCCFARLSLPRRFGRLLSPVALSGSCAVGPPSSAREPLGAAEDTEAAAAALLIFATGGGGGFGGAVRIGGVGGSRKDEFVEHGVPAADATDDECGGVDGGAFCF